MPMAVESGDRGAGHRNTAHEWFRVKRCVRGHVVALGERIGLGSGGTGEAGAARFGESRSNLRTACSKPSGGLCVPA